jgi:Protein of unknown function (DUF760)
LIGRENRLEPFGFAHVWESEGCVKVDLQQLSNGRTTKALSMNNLSSQSFGTVPTPLGSDNPLQNYLQALDMDAIARLSQPSEDVGRLMNQNLMGMLGTLPSHQFNVVMTTSREDLGQLLASAMMYGYFLRSAEQRMAFDQSLNPTSMEDQG